MRPLATVETKEPEKGTALFSRGRTDGRLLSQQDMVAVAGRIDVDPTTKVHILPYESLPQPIRDDAARMGEPETYQAVLWHGDVYLVEDGALGGYYGRAITSLYRGAFIH